MYFIQAGQAVLDDVIGVKGLSTVFASQKDSGGTAKVEEEDVEDPTMGVGKNTTAKSLDSSGEGGIYEDESKHYPIPVTDGLINGLFMLIL